MSANIFLATYIDSCSTGLTTVTATITKTVCNTCAQPTRDSVTSVYVCHNCGPSIVTVTITKPYTMPATGVPSYPTYTVVVPAKPASSTYGGDNKPSPSAQASSSVYAVDATASQPPAQPSMSSTPSSVSGKPYMPVYSPAVPEQPKKQVSTTISIVIVTPVPVAATLVPYPSAPAGAKNGTMGYPTATGTGAPTKPTSYVPPQFEGAANRLYVGLTGLTAVVAGLLVL
jgi:chitinase